MVTAAPEGTFACRLTSARATALDESAVSFIKWTAPELKLFFAINVVLKNCWETDTHCTGFSKVFSDLDKI
jgi:hypothetical protein